MIAGYFLTTIQSLGELNPPEAYFYFYGDRHVTRRNFISKDINKNIVEEVNKEDSNVYCLYTRENPDIEEILVFNNQSSINKSKFRANKTTVFIIHGWINNRTSTVNTVLTRAFLQDSDINVIVVDWGTIAQESYLTAVAAVPAVGRHLGNFIKWLTTLGVTYDKVHVVGHSLGAHVAGNAGRATEGKIKRITGLDPAGPLFDNSSYRLVKTDARYVEAIHTNTACLGYKDVCGHADFFPNGGAVMPNCFISFCSHSKSYYYMAETINNNSVYGMSCSSIHDVYSNNCRGEPYLMGNSDLTKNGSGVFRVDTKNILDEKLSKVLPVTMEVKVETRRLLNISALLNSCF